MVPGDPATFAYPRRPETNLRLPGRLGQSPQICLELDRAGFDPRGDGAFTKLLKLPKAIASHEHLQRCSSPSSSWIPEVFRPMRTAGRCRPSANPHLRSTSMSSVSATSDAIPCFFARKTIQEELSELVDITSFEDLKVRYEAIDRRYGRSKIRVDLATFVMNSAQVYLFENCSSIYSLLGSYPYPGFPHEKSSIHDALKRGEAAVVLTGPTYRGHMIEYLQELGPAAVAGCFVRMVSLLALPSMTSPCTRPSCPCSTSSCNQPRIILSLIGAGFSEPASLSTSSTASVSSRKRRAAPTTAVTRVVPPIVQVEVSRMQAMMNLPNWTPSLKPPMLRQPRTSVRPSCRLRSRGHSDTKALRW